MSTDVLERVTGGPRPARILVVTDRTAPSAELLIVVGARAAAGPTRFRLVVPNPARAELHLLHPERHEKAEEAELALMTALPAVEAAAGGPVVGTVSVRHDPMEAIEEILFSEPIDEIILAVLGTGAGRGLARWLHQDLEHRLAHFGLPVTSLPASDPSGRSETSGGPARSDG